MDEARFVCRVCEKQFSQYTCPRCNCRYCSLPCYKKHGHRCTESFMRENVMGEMQQIQPDDEGKQKMLEILKRFHSEDEEMPEIELDEEDDILSDNTVQKILDGNEVTLDDLSVEERKRFQKAVKSGELSKLVEPWQPWWLKPSARSISLSHDGTQRIKAIENASKSSHPEETAEISPNDIPKGPEAPLPSLHQLTNHEPSPSLSMHLLDILYSYCFTLRIYNGEWQSDPSGAVSVMLSMSSVLGDGGQPETVGETLAWCLEQICSPAFRHTGGLRFGLALFDDVISLLSLGGDALVVALCDLHRMIEAAIVEIKSEKKTRSRGNSKVKLGSRKVYFVMCWVNEQPSETWSSLAGQVQLEKGSMEIPDSKNERLIVSGKGNISKVLIEEA